MGDGEPVELVGHAELADLTAGLYRRGGEEFSRFTGFSDGVFGFAMTLLISTVVIPAVQPGALNEALGDAIPDLASFFISFVVVGYYWLAHHRLFAAFGAVTTVILRWNLAYMALIAFMPFPTALFGRYTDEPISVVLYAGALSLASVVEVAMMRTARASGLLRVALADDAYRMVLVAALLPVFVFALSGVAAALGADWAALLWFLIFPLEWMIARRSPASARLFG
jgi:uncharacterized membrane protein